MSQKLFPHFEKDICDKSFYILLVSLIPISLSAGQRGYLALCSLCTGIMLVLHMNYLALGITILSDTLEDVRQIINKISIDSLYND